MATLCALEHVYSRLPGAGYLHYDYTNVIWDDMVEFLGANGDDRLDEIYDLIDLGEVVCIAEVDILPED